jgi:hypothetical protein
MGQRQSHRGKHPEDDRLFAPRCIPTLREAVADLSFLFSRGYAETAALKLVGDHHQLDVRQRRAVLRASCSDDSLRRRAEHAVPLDALRERDIAVDGYNLLITVESMLSGGVLLRGRDGVVRDMASVHGSYRTVDETVDAIRHIIQTFAALCISSVLWYLDAPVSNSGRLRALLLTEAAGCGNAWEVELIDNVDQTLSRAERVVVTSDGWILDRAQAWANAADILLERTRATNQVIDVRP